jgi:hypothetical protein
MSVRIALGKLLQLLYTVVDALAGYSKDIEAGFSHESSVQVAVLVNKENKVT